MSIAAKCICHNCPSGYCNGDGDGNCKLKLPDEYVNPKENISDVVKVTHDKKDLRIYINELLHICVDAAELYATRSYIDESQKVNLEGFPAGSTKKYLIHFICIHGTFSTEYADRELWENILKLLDKNL